MIKSNPLLTVLVVALLIGGGIAVYNRLNPSVKVSDIKALTKKDTVHHKIDEQGREHGFTKVQEADAATLELANPFLDSILRANKILRKQLLAVTAVGVSTAGRIITRVDTVVIRDTAVPHFSYQSKFIRLEGYLTNPAVIDYETFDSLIVTTRTDRKWFLGKKTTYVDAYSLNPAAHIKGLTGLKVATQKAGRFGIGPMVGIGWNGSNWSPSVGASLHWSLIRF